MEDKAASTARMHVIKNRFGADGMSFPTLFNSSNGDIRLFEPTSKEGVEMQQKMDNGGDAVKDIMRDSWNKIKKNKDLDDFDQD